MNKKTFIKLCMNFNKEPNEELYNLWNEMLQDFDPYYVEVVINKIIQNEKYFPTLSKVLEEIKNLPNIEIPEEEKIKRMKAKGVIPEWLGKDIQSTPCEEDADFKSFIEEFRNGKISK